MSDLEKLQPGDRVIIERSSAGFTKNNLSLDKIIRITPSKRDIVLQSGRVFTEDGQEKLKAKGFKTSWSRLKKYDEVIWIRFILLERIQDLTYEFDFDILTNEEIIQINNILTKHKRSAVS